MPDLDTRHFFLELVQGTLYIDYQNRHGSKDIHKNSQ